MLKTLVRIAKRQIQKDLLLCNKSVHSIKGRTRSLIS